MTGSARQPSASNNAPRAPYAVPQSVTFSVTSGVASATLSPFVPPEFRGKGARGLAYEPTTESAIALPWIETFAADSAHESEGSSESTRESANQTSTSATPHIESVASAASTVESAFAAVDIDAPAHAEEAAPSPEDSWMMGEAGKRLEEITQSLSSLDAVRAAQLAQKVSVVAPDQSTNASPTPLPIWGDDEWMDIMPTASVSHDVSGALPIAQAATADPPRAFFGDDNQCAIEAAAEAALEAQARHFESAAQALESVARRIRAGDFALPDFEPEMGDAAVLASILASLLRTGR